MSAGLRRMNVSEEDIAAMQKKREDDALEAAQALGETEDFEIHEDNWDSWLFFLTVQTQWIYAVSGLGAQRAGMRYEGVESGARMAGLPRRQWPALFADVQVMERAVLAVDAELAEARSNE